MMGEPSITSETIVSPPRQSFASKPIIWAILIVAIVIFNDWVIALFFHNSILLRGADISELSANGQPHALLFRIFDIIAACLLSVFIVTLRPKFTKGYSYLVVVVAALSIAAIFDAINTLKCSWTAQSSCVVEAVISRNQFTLPSHAYSSIAMAICFILVPLSGFFLNGFFRGTRILKVASLIAVSAELEANLAIVYQFIVHQSYKEPGWGVNQELQVLILSAWFIILGLTALTSKSQSSNL